jgi:hypothetical protein
MKRDIRPASRGRTTNQMIAGAHAESATRFRHRKGLPICSLAALGTRLSQGSRPKPVVLLGREIPCFALALSHSV